MMKDGLVIINCAASQTRAAYLVDDVVRKFWFGPARGCEEHDLAPQAGDLYCGRITGRDGSNSGVFVDIGNKLSVFLPLKASAGDLNDGAYVQIEIVTPARGAKSAVAIYSGDGDVSTLGRLRPRQDAALQAAAAFGSQAHIVIDDGSAAAVLKNELGTRDIEHRATDLFSDYGGEEALSESLETILALADGVRIIFQETHAGVMIDIDGGASVANSTLALRRNINTQAAKRIALEIERRNLSGQILIDFLKMPKRVQTLFGTELSSIFKDIDKPGWTRSGIFAFTRARIGMSLLEYATQADNASPLPGRVFTLDWCLRDAGCSLEAHLRKSPGAQVTMECGGELYAAFDENEDLRERLQNRYGARYSVIHGAAMGPRAFSILLSA